VNGAAICPVLDGGDASADPAVDDPALRGLLAPIFPQIADWDEVAVRVARGSSLADALETVRRAA
jgi:hypothetical protein